MSQDSVKSVEGFQHLFELGSHLDKMKEKEIEEIVQNAVEEDREIQYRRKLVHYEIRNLNQDNQSDVSNSKAEAQRKNVGAIYDAASVVLSVAGAATGLSPLDVFARGFDKASSQKREMNQADIQMLDHTYSQLGSLISDRSQQVHGTDKEHQQDSDIIDRIMNARQRIAESITSASG